MYFAKETRRTIPDLFWTRVRYAQFEFSATLALVAVSF